MMKNADQPAFPWVAIHPDLGVVDQYPGISKREYFAARAPEMPEWWRCKDKISVGNPPYVAPESLSFIFRNKTELDNWQENPSLEIFEKAPLPDPELKKWAADYIAWLNNRKIAPIINFMNKIRAWRYYYADMMLAEEPGKTEQQP